MKAVSIVLLVLCSVIYVNCAVRATLSYLGTTCGTPAALVGGSAIAPAFDCQPGTTANTFLQYQCSGTAAPYTLQVRTCSESTCTNATACNAYANVPAANQCFDAPVAGVKIALSCYESFAAVPTALTVAGFVADFYASNASTCTTGSTQGYKLFGPSGQCIGFPAGSGFASGSSVRATCTANALSIAASRNSPTCGTPVTTTNFANANTCYADNISFFNNNWGVAGRCVAASAPTVVPTTRPGNTTTGATGTTTTSSAAALFVSAFVLLASVFVAAF